MRPFVITTRKRTSENVHMSQTALFTEEEAMLINVALCAAVEHDQQLAALFRDRAAIPEIDRDNASVAAKGMDERIDKLQRLQVKFIALLIEGKVLE